MAKNYTFTEVVEIISAGKDMEAIQDIGRRYPILLAKTTALVAKAGSEFVEFASFIPEHVSANKINMGIKEIFFGSNDDDASESVETSEEKPEKATEPKTKATEKATETKATSGGTEYDSMTGKDLYALVKERGLLKACENTKKDGLVAALKAADKGGKAKVAEPKAKAEKSEKVEKSEYEGKTAMELYKMAKEAGLKPEPKQKSAVYIAMLEEAKAEDTDEAIEEDWGEEETVEEPKAKAKDDEDWDI